MRPTSKRLGDDMNLEYGGTYTAPDKTPKILHQLRLYPRADDGGGDTLGQWYQAQTWGHGLSNGQYYVSDKPKALWQPSY